MKKIAIVGLDRAGLPLSLQFAGSGAAVTGIDADSGKVKALLDGQSYIAHITEEAITEEIRRGRFTATDDFSRIQGLDAVVICVQAPLCGNREPDLSPIIAAGKSIAPHLRRGTLVVLESAPSPGATETRLRAALEEGSGLKAGLEFHLAFSPGREEPAGASIPVIIGGYTPACLEKTMELYSLIAHTLVPVSSCRAAEAARLIENIFQSVNIAMVNELKTVYQAMGIDIWEVIEAAKTNPSGFMPFYPGFLPPPLFSLGRSARLIELAGEINTAMPDRVVDKVAEALNDRCKSVKGSAILILGVDACETPVYSLMEKLLRLGARVDYHDPRRLVIRPARDYPALAGKPSVAWKKEIVQDYDCVVICAAHQDICHAQLAEWADLIVDTRNAMANVCTRLGQLWKA